MSVAPVVNSITFDKTSYLPGQVITATVNYTPGLSARNFTGTATDSVSGLTGSLVVQFTAPDATTASASDANNRTWTKVSDANGVAVFTATA